jgi:hypothetical protein
MGGVFDEKKPTTFLKSYKKKHFYEWGDVFEQAETAKIRLITS